MLISFESGDNLIQLWNVLWAEDVQRRDVKRDSPGGWRGSFGTDLWSTGLGPFEVGLNLFRLCVGEWTQEAQVIWFIRPGPVGTSSRFSRLYVRGLYLA